MSTQPQQQALVQTSPMVLELAADWKITPATMISTLKSQVFPTKDKNNNPIEVSNEMVVAFLQVCNTYKLNPFVKEIYAFPSKGGGFVPMVPIDGWANIINRSEQFDGLEFIDEWENTKPGEKKTLISTTCVIYRKDRSHPIKITEYMQECYQGNKDPWVKWPARMLRHKALIQCARIAFSLAGIFDPDEAERIAEGETKHEIKRPTVIEGTQTTSAPAAVQGRDGGAANGHTTVNGSSTANHKPGTAAPAEDKAPSQDPNTCPCVCCKQKACSCKDKDEIDQCGCAPCTNYVRMVTVKDEAKPEEKAAVGEVVAQSKPAGPYVEQGKLKRLFAAAAGVGIKVVKDSHDDELHKILKEKFGIESIKEIPVTMLDQIIATIAPSLKTK